MWKILNIYFEYIKPDVSSIGGNSAMFLGKVFLTIQRIEVPKSWVLSSVTVLGLVAHKDIGTALLQTQQTVYPVA